jgi:hypothetical protein
VSASEGEEEVDSPEPEKPPSSGKKSLSSRLAEAAVKNRKRGTESTPNQVKSSRLKAAAEEKEKKATATEAGRDPCNFSVCYMPPPLFLFLNVLLFPGIRYIPSLLSCQFFFSTC